MEFPLVYFDGNLVVNKAGEWWAAYRLRPYTYQYLSEADKIGRLQRLTRLVSSIDHEGQMLMVPRTVHADKILVRQAWETMDRALPYGVTYLQLLGNEVAKEEAIEYDYYVLFKLKRPTRKGLGPLLSGRQFRWHLANLKRIFQETRRGVPILLARTLEAYAEAEEQLFARLSPSMMVDRCAGAAEITHLVQRRFWAGIGEEPGRPGWSPDTLAREEGGELRLEPLRVEIQSLASGVIDLRHWRRVAVTQVHDGQESTGYQAFMALSSLPDEMNFPGCEWLYGLHELEFPVEACIRWSPVPYRQAIEVLRRKRLETRDQIEQAESVGDLAPMDAQEADVQIDELEAKLKAEKTPNLYLTAFLGVAASTEDELWKRVTSIQDRMTAEQTPFECSAGDQHRMFVEFLPGSPWQFRPMVTDAISPYAHRLCPEILAASMVGATQALGDPIGTYIGTTGGLGRPVFFDAARGPQINRSASAAFLGTLGGGKTFLARLLILQAVLMGARALWIDPKGESARMVKKLPPEISKHINLITLSSREEDTGLLDLLAMARYGDRREAKNMARNVLGFLLNIDTGSEEDLALMEAIAAAVDEEHPSTTGVIRHLLAQEGVGNRMGRYLEHLRGQAYANLLFGDGTERSLDVRAPYNILQLQHLTLPEKGRERKDMTPDEAISLGVLMAVVSFATHFCHQDRHVFKTVVLDEAWKIMANSHGLAVVTHLLRTGRAMNNAIYVITQSHKDLDNEGIRNNFGLRFVFASSDEEEVRGVLRFLGMEESAENIGLVRSLPNGTCLYRDLEGRVGILEVDPVFKELEDAFRTNPPKTAAAAI